MTIIGSLLGLGMIAGFAALLAYTMQWVFMPVWNRLVTEPYRKKVQSVVPGMG